MKGKGSLLHKTLQLLLAERARAGGHVAVIEADIQGKKIDVLIQAANEGLVAIEIHLNRHLELIADQLQKNFAVGIRRQIVVVPDLWLERTWASLRKHIKPETLAAVRVCSVSECSTRNFNWSACNTAEQTHGTKSE